MDTSVAIKNAVLNAYETVIGASPVMKIFTGAKPASCAAADSGTELASGTLPADFMADAAAGSKDKLGTWALTAGDDGVAGHFRIYSSGGTCHKQGTCSLPGAGGELELQNTNIASGQPITITGFTINAGN